MKRITALFLILGVILVFASSAFALTAIQAHEKFIYPIVRITYGNTGGSGTIIHSLEDGTFILTNNHVIAEAIRIVEEWNSEKQEELKTEKRSVVYVEIFKYRNISTPVGTLKVEADIVAYNEDEDIALLKLRFDELVPDVASLIPATDIDKIQVMDETVAVGCSLLFPPIPSTGILTRKNFLIQSLPFCMSSAQIIYGNSGGGMFNAITGEFIGIPSRVPVIGWGTPITHMGLFIPVDRIYQWFETIGYESLIP